MHCTERISDELILALQVCGVSLGFGQAMGNDEPVTPVFPNSDYR